MKTVHHFNRLVKSDSLHPLDSPKYERRKKQQQLQKRPKKSTLKWAFESNRSKVISL